MTRYEPPVCTGGGGPWGSLLVHSPGTGNSFWMTVSSRSPHGHGVAGRVSKQRLLTLESTEPIAFRRQNFGDYEIPSLHLKEGLEPAGRTGFGLHVRG